MIEQNKGLIYMRTSPSGKSYIGQTVQSEEKRWKQHCNNAFNPSSPLYNNTLSRAIRKYGKDNFQVTILKNDIPKVKLNYYEEYYIKLYDTYQNGYNSSMGGEGGGCKYNYNTFYQLWLEGKSVSEISQINRCAENTTHRILQNCGITEEQFEERFQETISLFKEEDRKVLKQKYENGQSIAKIADEYGASYTAVRNALIKAGVQMRAAQGIESIRIAQIDIKTKQVIEIYDSVRKAAKAVNGAHQSIGLVANHYKNRKTAYGYHWEWENNLKEYLNGKND